MRCEAVITNVNGYDKLKEKRIIMPFRSSDRAYEKSVIENAEENLRQENAKLRCQLKELQMVIAEKEVRLEKDFNSEVKKERLCQISLKVFEIIEDRYNGDLSKAIKHSMNYAKTLLQEG